MVRSSTTASRFPRQTHSGTSWPVVASLKAGALEGIGENLLDARADHRGVVSDENFHPRFSSFAAAVAQTFGGTRTVTVVPWRRQSEEKEDLAAHLRRPPLLHPDQADRPRVDLVLGDAAAVIADGENQEALGKPAPHLDLGGFGMGANDIGEDLPWKMRKKTVLSQGPAAARSRRSRPCTGCPCAAESRPTAISIAAASPRLSSTPGRSSVAMPLTVAMVASMSADICFILRWTPRAPGRLSRQPGKVELEAGERLAEAHRAPGGRCGSVPPRAPTADGSVRAPKLIVPELINFSSVCSRSRRLPRLAQGAQGGGPETGQMRLEDAIGGTPW